MPSARNRHPQLPMVWDLFSGPFSIVLILRKHVLSSTTGPPEATLSVYTPGPGPGWGVLRAILTWGKVPVLTTTHIFANNGNICKGREKKHPRIHMVLSVFCFCLLVRFSKFQQRTTFLNHRTPGGHMFSLYPWPRRRPGVLRETLSSGPPEATLSLYTPGPSTDRGVLGGIVVSG